MKDRAFLSRSHKALIAVVIGMLLFLCSDGFGISAAGESSSTPSANSVDQSSTEQAVPSSSAENSSQEDEKKAYSNAVENDMLWAYQTFLEQYPTAKMRKDVEKRMKQFAKFTTKKTVAIKDNELKKKYHWNGSRNIWTVNNAPFIGGFVDGKPVITGRICLGNLEFNATAMSVYANGVMIDAGTTITFKSVRKR